MKINAKELVSMLLLWFFLFSLVLFVERVLLCSSHCLLPDASALATKGLVYAYAIIRTRLQTWLRGSASLGSSKY